MRHAIVAATLFLVAGGLVAMLASPPGHADDMAAKGGAPSAPVDLENATCPVTGKPVTPGVTANVDGVVVHFCSKHCGESYRANPAKYQAALRKDPVVAKRLDVLASETKGGHGAMPASGGGELHDAMRKLWEDHVWWTRLFVVSATADLPDKDATTKRLLKNQTDLGNAIKPFYGEEAGNKLTALLKDHILIAADLVGASKAQDAVKAQDANKRWLANADEIAGFLAAANPGSWPLADGKAMMREHLQLTTDEVKARLNQQWDADIAAWEKVRDQALKMADMLTEGIRKQFPDKVR